MNRNNLYADPTRVPIVGVAVHIGRWGPHAAIVHKNENGDHRFLHQTTDVTLWETEVDARYLAAVPSFPDFTMVAIAGLCRRMARNPSTYKFLFGFRFDPSAKFVIDPATDRCRLDAPDPDAGLNCATFAAAVFHHTRPLINLNDWPTVRVSAIRAQQRQIEFLRSHGHDSRAKELENQVGSLRVSPEELVGACLEDDLPASYRQCCQNARIIRNLLKDRRITES